MIRTLAALLCASTAAHAEAPCLPTLDAFAAALERGFGEVAQIGGVMQEGRALLMFANPKTGTWTIVVQAPDGRYCSPAAGRDYRAALQGDPA